MGKKRINLSVGIAWFSDILNIDAPLIEIGFRSAFTNSGVSCMQQPAGGSAHGLTRLVPAVGGSGGVGRENSGH
jgi:hypothetical protein